jgi:hypothetical protein
MPGTPVAPPLPPGHQIAAQPENRLSERSVIVARKSGKKSLWITLGILGAPLLLLGTFFCYKVLTGDSFDKRIDAALAQDHIFSPPGDCVADIMTAERAKHPRSPKLDKAALKIKAKVWPFVTDALKHWYKDSDSKVNWVDLGKYCALLGDLFPNENEIAASQAYPLCQYT